MLKWLNAFYHKRINRSSPWIDIISEGIDRDGQVRLEFDWNAAFIQHLHQHGFNHLDEEECVKEWFQALTNERVAALVAEVETERERLMMGQSGNIESEAHPYLTNPGRIEFK